MIIPRRKQKSGQAGNWDTHPFLRSERVEGVQSFV